MTIQYRDNVWQIIEAMHVKPGKGSAFVQTKLRKIESDEVMAVNFRAGEKISPAVLVRTEMIYLYREAQRYVLIDAAGCDEVELDEKQLGRNADLLKEGQREITVVRHDGRVVNECMYQRAPYMVP